MIRAALEIQIAADDEQDVQVLTFVLVKALDLDIEQARRLGIKSRSLADALRQQAFVMQLDFAPGIAKVRSVGPVFELPQTFQIIHPGISDRVVDQGSQHRVGQNQKPAWGHAVSDVGEAFRLQGVEIFQYLLLQQATVQLRHTIDVVATHARWAMRTLRPSLSSMRDRRASRVSLSGESVRTLSRKRRLIS